MGYKKKAIDSYYILALILGAGITYLVVQRVIPGEFILLAVGWIACRWPQLRLMATGLKYQEITGKLVVSVNKVHHHTRNIYGKLDVNSRALIHKKIKFVEKTPKYFGDFLLVNSTLSDSQMSIFSL